MILLQSHSLKLICYITSRTIMRSAMHLCIYIAPLVHLKRLYRGLGIYQYMWLTSETHHLTFQKNLFMAKFLSVPIFISLVKRKTSSSWLPGSLSSAFNSLNNLSSRSLNTHNGNVSYLECAYPDDMPARNAFHHKCMPLMFNLGNKISIITAHKTLFREIFQNKGLFCTAGNTELQ